MWYLLRICFLIVLKHPRAVLITLSFSFSLFCLLGTFFCALTMRFFFRKWKQSVGRKEKKCSAMWKELKNHNLLRWENWKVFLLFFLLAFAVLKICCCCTFSSANLFSSFKKLSIYFIVEKIAINFKHFFLEHSGVVWVKSAMNQSYKCERADNETQISSVILTMWIEQLLEYLMKTSSFQPYCNRIDWVVVLFDEKSLKRLTQFFLIPREIFFILSLLQFEELSLGWKRRDKTWSLWIKTSLSMNRWCKGTWNVSDEAKLWRSS